jgi:hypothetical protein
MNKVTSLEFWIILSGLFLYLCTARLLAQSATPSDPKDSETVETLLGEPTRMQLHYFWGPETRIHFFSGELSPSAAWLLGGKTGITLGRHWLLGAGGWGKINRTFYYGAYTDLEDGIDNPHQKMAVGYGYGGLLLGYVFTPTRAMHASFTTLLGGGTSNQFIIEPDGDHGTTFNSPTFGIVEPTLNLELNLTRKLRLEVGIGYRWINANRFRILTEHQLNGFTLQAALKMGHY